MHFDPVEAGARVRSQFRQAALRETFIDTNDGLNQPGPIADALTATPRARECLKAALLQDINWCCGCGVDQVFTGHCPDRPWKRARASIELIDVDFEGREGDGLDGEPDRERSIGLNPDVDLGRAVPEAANNQRVISIDELKPEPSFAVSALPAVGACQLHPRGRNAPVRGCVKDLTANHARRLSLH